jgi:hypothetical protein
MVKAHVQGEASEPKPGFQEALRDVRKQPNRNHPNSRKAENKSANVPLSITVLLFGISGVRLGSCVVPAVPVGGMTDITLEPGCLALPAILALC